MSEDGSLSLGDAMTQDIALDVLETQRNAFVTGPPGAGKSWLLRNFVGRARRERTVAVTASTGIAGTHIGGMTLHSWAGLGVRDEYTAKDIVAIADKAWVANRIRNADVLVIDEISMLHPVTFEAADAVCRRVRRDERAFGGIQVVLCGDFFQLPPVSRDGVIAFVYGSPTWKKLDPAVLYLSQQFRQVDDALLGLLHAMRDDEITEEHGRQLQARLHAPLGEGVAPTRLHTHNVDVDRVNAVELEKLPGAIRRFEMVSSGPPPLVEALRSSCLAPSRLQLKEGAAVMFVKNNTADGYVNGTLGRIVGFSGNAPKVLTDRGEEIVVQPQSWATEDSRGRPIASLAQVPLRLAWAISVHKSQGMSLSAAEIDLSRAFVAGLGYVALSRVTTMAGVRLLGLNRQALAVSPLALQIDRELRRASDEVLAGAAASSATTGAASEAIALF